ncbi:ISL3 family transposase, partial [Lactobacillus helveticus]
MSSLNHCIKFELDIKDENIVLALLHNGHLVTNIRYLTANASLPVIIRLAKQRVKCRDCDHWSMAQSEL